MKQLAGILGSSTFEGDEPEYPDFEILVEQLNDLIEVLIMLLI